MKTQNLDEEHHSNITYRPEIDGLRALAVMLVIIYHAEISLWGRPLFPVGFIGVDIFFVISGYLIARIIFREIQTTGKLSILGFYERRARRILPALATVMLVSLPVAYEVFLPSRLFEYAQSLFSSTFFLSNILFYLSSIEYGAESSLLKPFLHTWSLSVEEQFYLVFPLFAVFAVKLFRRHLIAVLVVLAVISLEVANWQSTQNPELGFFSPLTRIWELLAGALLALFEPARKNFMKSPLAPALSAVGLMLIFHSAIFFSSDTVHPGYATIIPVTGTALVIFLAHRDNLIGFVFSGRAIRSIGLISYSLYLWHFPIFAFQRVYFDTWNTKLALLGIIGTVSAAFLSYHFVEKPFRDRQRVKPKGFILSLVISFSVILGAGAFIMSKGGDFRDSLEPENFLANFEFDNALLRKQKNQFLNADAEGSSDEDVNSERINLLFVGNSHSQDMYLAFQQNPELFPEFSFSRRTIQLGCFDGETQVSNDFLGSRKYRNADVIFVATSWSESWYCSPEDRASSTMRADTEGWAALYPRLIQDGKRVVVAGQNESFAIQGTLTLVDTYIQDLDMDMFETLDEFIDDVNRYASINKRSNLAWYLAKLEEIEAKLNRPQAVFLSKRDLICTLGEEVCLAMTSLGEKVYYDFGHYSLPGARAVGEKIYRTGWFEPVYEMLRDEGVLAQ